MGDPMEWQAFREQISVLSGSGIAISFLEPYIYTSECEQLPDGPDVRSYSVIFEEPNWGDCTWSSFELAQVVSYVYIYISISLNLWIESNILESMYKWICINGINDAL
jgi:ABC-type spermidine/putrescine transport system permease subunit II